MTELDSNDWTAAVNRGGLIIVSDLMFTFISRLETVLRQYITETKSHDLNLKSSAPNIMSDDDVLFYWSMLTVEIEDEAVSNQLLCMIVEHWITIRGFSHASSIIELYKQANKKNIQKSKGLRKSLYKAAEA